MELQITTLIENTPDDEGRLAYEHGLSFYIEFQGKKLLFDSGQTGAFLENAEKLKKDISDIDYFLISHGHYDHSSGVMQTIEKLGQKTKMLVGKDFFAPKYKLLEDGEYKYTGNPFTEAELTERLQEKNIVLEQLDEDVKYVTDKIVIFGNFKSETGFEQHNPNFFIRQEPSCQGGVCTLGGWQQDAFREEIAIGLITDKGLVLVVGCSHVGIINILKHVKKHIDLPIYSVLGGTHLVAADKVRLCRTVEELEKLGLRQIAVSHCTGDEGVCMLRERFGENFIQNNTGNVYKI